MKKLSLLLLAALLLPALNTKAQLYIGGGPNILNLTSGDMNKDKLKGTFGASASMGYAIKQKYYVGWSVQTYSFLLDESKVEVQPGYQIFSDNILCANVGLFVDMGYKYTINRKSSLLGVVSLGNYLLAKPSYTIINTNNSTTLIIDDLAYTGFGYQLKASYLYNVGRNFGFWGGVSYMHGRGKANNTNATNLESNLGIFSGHVGIFFSFFNKAYGSASADKKQTDKYPGLE